MVASARSQVVFCPQFVLTFVFCLSVRLLAQSPTSYSAESLAPLEGKRIVAIDYSPASSLDPADLATAQPVRAGDIFSAAQTSLSVDSLFATGMFDDISVKAEPEANGVKLTFEMKPAWFVGGVNVEGKIPLPPNRAQIGNAGPFILGTAFRQEDLDTALTSIKSLMKANGLYEATVTPDLTRDPRSQEMIITFQVKAGKRAKYEQPAITGETLTLSDSTILRATGWRIPLIHWWRQVTDSRTRKGVQSVLGKYQGKERLTAKVELKSLDYDAATRRVKPSLDIQPGPKVEIKAVEAKVSKKVLKRYVPVYEEKALYTDLLVEGKRNLQDYFQSQGYYDVEVDFRQLPPTKDLEVVEYVVSRGTRYKMAHLAIQGNHYFNNDQIRERMIITPAAFNLRHGRYSEAFLRKDEANIADLYKSNGFQDVKIASNVDRNYGGKAGQVAVTVTVTEGTQWFVDHVTVSGVHQIDEAAITRQFASLPGQPFSEVSLATDRNTVLTYYYSHGFPSATLIATWTKTATPHHVNVVYTIKEGQEQFVRDVITTGIKNTRRRLIDTAMTMKPGLPLSPVEETEIQKRLYDLGVFARVDTAIEDPDGDTQHKFVLYNFEEANRYNVAVGIGAQAGRFGTPSNTSLASPGGQNGFSPELSVDISRLNFLGLGHTVSLRTLYSTIEKRFSLSYLQPRFENVEGRNITYSLLYDNTLNVRTFASKREEASVQMSQRFTKAVNGLFRFAYRRVSVQDVVIPVLLVPQLLQPVRIGIFSSNITQDRRDNSADPHHGMLNTIDLGISTKYFGSQRSFGRALIRNATYYSLTHTLVLARQTQFGIIQPFSPPAGLTADQSIPLPERFFGGGADSLRAFSFNQAGPRDVGTPVVAGGMASQPTGFPLGGNALFFNNVELRFPFIGENIQGVFFHDMGNVFTSINDMSFRFNQRNVQDFNYTVHAVGFGVRYKTPVGPIRLDLAYSINPPSYLGFSGTPDQLLNCNPNLPPSSLPGYCQSTRQSTGHFQFFFSIGQAF